MYDPGNGVSLPVVVRRVNPTYTPEAQEQKIEGIVGMTAVVHADGHVGDVRVTSSLDAKHGLDQQATNALKQWEFKPGTKDGQPVSVRIKVQMMFTLR